MYSRDSNPVAGSGLPGKIACSEDVFVTVSQYTNEQIIKMMEVWRSRICCPGSFTSGAELL